MYSGRGTATCPYTMLWNNASHAQDLRCSNVSHPRLSSMEVTLEVGEKSFMVHLAARRWTISSLVVKSFEWGSHALAAYSSCGRTMVLYVVALIVLMLRLMSPNDLLALLTTLSTCVFHLRSEAMLTPRYLAWSTTSRMCPCSEYLAGIGCLALLTWMTWHLVGLNSMSQSASHICKWSKSFWMVLLSLTHPITGFKDDSAYVTTKTADRNQHSTEDG